MNVDILKLVSFIGVLVLSIWWCISNAKASISDYHTYKKSDADTIFERFKKSEKEEEDVNE